MNVRATALQLVRGALVALEAERSLINDLNVYPVPDGDTGTNLALTVRAVVEEVEACEEDDLAGLAGAVTKGSLMGARGNSGVILSQIVRGACEVLGSAPAVGAQEFKKALHEASAAAYRAVKQPVEGTMLTVVREMAAAAQAVPDSAGVAELGMIVEQAGRAAVERTTEQLDALRQAGVVDAGGYGLLVLFRGVMRAFGEPAGAAAAGAPPAQSGLVAEPQLMQSGEAELSLYRYCTSFLLKGDGLHGQELEDYLAPLGDSALVVGDEHMLKAHVHTDDPGVVLSHAVTLGALSEVEINDMHQQTKERDARLRSAGRPTGTVAVAVVAGEGNKQLFRTLGVHAVVDGGQSMNPSAAQLLEAIDGLGADQVVVLPNNGNVILTAEQAAGMSDRHVAVVPAGSIPAGLAAMVAFDGAADAADNARAMEAALIGVRSAEITHAVRDSELDGVVVAQGQVIGLVDGTLVAAGDDLLAVFKAVVEEFASRQPEIVTVLTALNGSQVSVAELEASARAACPNAEIEFHIGGQPLYPILASAE